MVPDRPGVERGLSDRILLAALDLNNKALLQLIMLIKSLVPLRDEIDLEIDWGVKEARDVQRVALSGMAKGSRRVEQCPDRAGIDHSNILTPNLSRRGCCSLPGAYWCFS